MLVTSDPFLAEFERLAHQVFGGVGHVGLWF